MDGPLGEIEEREALPVDLHPNDAAGHALFLDPAQRVSGDAFDFEVDEPVESHLVGVVVVGHVGAPVEDPALDTSDVDRAGGSDLVWLPSPHDSLPQIRATARVAQVDLVPDLGRP